MIPQQQSTEKDVLAIQYRYAKRKAALHGVRLIDAIKRSAMHPDSPSSSLKVKEKAEAFAEIIAAILEADSN